MEPFKRLSKIIQVTGARWLAHANFPGCRAVRLVSKTLEIKTCKFCSMFGQYQAFFVYDFWNIRTKAYIVHSKRPSGAEHRTR